MNQPTQSTAYYEANKAHLHREIKSLLIPWLTFKLYIKFSDRKRTGEPQKKRTFYGNEHQCTYDQCFYKKIDRIILRRHKGYNDLIHLVEHTLKGKYLSAKIYMRGDDGNFDVLCREYFKGGLAQVNDPVLSEDEIRELYFMVQENRLIIFSGVVIYSWFG